MTVTTAVFALAVMVMVIVAAVAVYGAYSAGGANHGTSSSTSASNAGGTSLASGTISVTNAMSLMRNPLPGASVSQESNSITFAPSSGKVDIVAFATTQLNASVFTGMRPPPYAQGDVFVVDGLVDPTLYIPAGASATFTIVNMDAANYNDLVISTVGPPFAANLSQYTTWHGMGMMGSGFQGFLYMMSVMDPANYGGGWMSSYSYTVTIPNYADLWYLCTYPGHAMGGMYGEIVTTGTSGSSSPTDTRTGASTSSSSTSTNPLPPGTTSISAAQALLKTPLTGASVSASANSITFTSSDINLTAFAMMPDNATNLTGMKPPSYAQDDVFVLGGLIDPTLHVPKGATVHVTVVNLDDDMYHDFVVTTLSPPYPYMMMQGMMWGGGYFLYMMPVLSPANYAAGWAPVYSYTMTIPNVPALWYVCTYPGHAEVGMYGEILTS